ncbi:MAG: helicase, partial [Nitrospirae bacterium]
MALPPLPIPEALRAEIAGHIARAEGCEVFFAGDTDGEGRLARVTVLARGHATAVPALTRDLAPGQVVLHNHPSGDLTPSDPDIEIASLLGERGVGFAIVDNEARRVLTVTQPHRPEAERPVEAAWIDAFFAAGGPLARVFDGYEPRPPQVAMAHACAEVINRARPRLVEAGTGTGKSLAYLAPAARWAQANGKRVVVATHTIHLQQQLVTKDIPQLAQALEAPLKAVLVKGRGNYLCLRKLHEAVAQPDLYDEEREALEQLARWAEQTRDGSLADLAEPPPAAVWERVRSDADSTLRARCRYFDRCFFYRARREAAGAQILIANHALLAADLAVRQATGDLEGAAVLPPYHRVIVDEAHHLEDSAVRHLGSQTSRLACLHALGRLHRSRGATLLGRLARALGQLPPFEEREGLRAEAGERLPARVEEVRGLARATFDELVALLLPDPLFTSCDLDAEATAPQRPESDRLLKELAAALNGLGRELHGLLRACAALPPTLADRLASPLTDCAGAVSRLQGIADALLACTGARPENRVRWVERRANQNVVLFCLPVELRGELTEALFRPYPGTLLTSATLSTGGDCGFVADRLGLEPGHDPEPLAPLVLP